MSRRNNNAGDVRGPSTIYCLHLKGNTVNSCGLAASALTSFLRVSITKWCRADEDSSELFVLACVRAQ